MPKAQECTDNYILTKKLFLAGLRGLQSISNLVERPCTIIDSQINDTLIHSNLQESEKVKRNIENNENTGHFSNNLRAYLRRLSKLLCLFFSYFSRRRAFQNRSCILASYLSLINLYLLFCFSVQEIITVTVKTGTRVSTARQISTNAGQILVWTVLRVLIKLLIIIVPVRLDSVVRSLSIITYA